MAFLDPNTLVGILHGKLGNLVLVRTQDGKIYVRHRPQRKAAFTPDQLANQSRITLANRYVQSIRQQRELYAAYQIAAKLKGKRACDLAKADFAHAPVIEDIDVSGYHGHAAETIRARRGGRKKQPQKIFSKVSLRSFSTRGRDSALDTRDMCLTVFRQPRPVLSPGGTSNCMSRANLQE